MRARIAQPFDVVGFLFESLLDLRDHRVDLFAARLIRVLRGRGLRRQRIGRSELPVKRRGGDRSDQRNDDRRPPLRAALDAHGLRAARLIEQPPLELALGLGVLLG